MNKAIHYYTLAANQDDPDALYQLGFFFYCNGICVTKDIPKAIYYYKQFIFYQKSRLYLFS